MKLHWFYRRDIWFQGVIALVADDLTGSTAHSEAAGWASGKKDSLTPKAQDKSAD